LAAAVAASCVGQSVAATSAVGILEKYSFADFLGEHGKSYEADEHSKRKAIFDVNLAKVLAHNRDYEGGKQTWYLAMNHLADWTPEEYKKLRSKKTGDQWGQSPEVEAELASAGPNPTSVDWRTKGNVVTKVKNQGGCGSCWAFAATETMESHYAIASGKLLTLAPQAYVNCVKNPNSCGGTGGCEGATAELGYNTSKTLGLPLESDLPYQGADGACKPYKAAVKNTGYVKLPANDATALETAVTTKGPIAITAAAEPWMLYGGGVFAGCTGDSGADLDHGIQVVGYTPTYWIVRNSWGPTWGEKGYIYISRKNDATTSIDKTPGDGVACKPYPATQTVKGECGMLSDSAYPTGLSAGDSEIVV